jgi:hypothetical protein
MMSKESNETEVVVMKTPEAAKFSKYSAAYLQNLRHYLKGPPFIRRGRSIFYLKSDLIKWLEDGRVTPGK